jgi:hypothetical protein
MPGRHQTSTLCLLPSRPFQFQFDAASAVDTLLIGAIAIVHVAVEDQHAQHQSFREQFLGRDYETIERQEPESFPETSTPEGGLNSRHSGKLVGSAGSRSCYLNTRILQLIQLRRMQCNTICISWNCIVSRHYAVTPAVGINNCRPLFSASGHHRCIHVVARNLQISNPVLAKWRNRSRKR